MSFMDKIKSLFSGGSSAGADEHAGHDHSTPAEPMPPADPAGTPMSEPASDEDRPA